MRKNVKKLLLLIFALTVMACCTDAASIDTQAAGTLKSERYSYDQKNGIVWESKTRQPVGIVHGAIQIYMENKGYYVSSVKSSSSNLLVKIHSNSFYNGSILVAPEIMPNTDFHSFSQIECFAKKKGTYTVTFTVKNSEGKKVCTKKVKVYASPITNPFKSFSYAGTKENVGLYGADITTTKASGKIEVQANSTYKIKSIAVATKYDKQGDPIFDKEIKNGQRITLSKSTKYSETYHADAYSEQGREHDYLMPMTVVQLTFYDKKLKMTETANVYIFNTK